MKFCTHISKISNKVEKDIINELLRTDFKYKQITPEFVKNIISKLNLHDTITSDIIFSLNKSYITQHIIENNNKNIKKYKKEIMQDYNTNKNIVKMSKEYDVSPLNIMREIIKDVYKTKISKISKNNLNILSENDKIMFQQAKDNDDFAQVNQLESLDNSLKFELKIQQVLEEHNIEFKTQAELVEEQIKLYGSPRSTPDFLLTKPLIINDFEINWIDAKNYYGSNTYYIKDSIKHQTRKYIKKHGSGCIVYSLGFNEKLNFDNILIMNFNDFKDIKKC